MKQVIGGSLGAVYREKGLGKKYRLFHLCKIVFLLSLEFFIHKPRHGERRKKEERGREGGRERVGGKERERERERERESDSDSAHDSQCPEIYLG
jgi:hypothetical protein